MKIKLAQTSVVLKELLNVSESFSKYILEKLKEKKEKGVFLKTFLEKVKSWTYDDSVLYSVTKDEFPEQFEILPEFNEVEITPTRVLFIDTPNVVSGEKEEIFNRLFSRKFHLTEKDGKVVELKEFVSMVEDFANRLIKFLIEIDDVAEQKRVKLLEEFEKTEMFKYLKKKNFEKRLEE